MNAFKISRDGQSYRALVYPAGIWVERVPDVDTQPTLWEPSALNPSLDMITSVESILDQLWISDTLGLSLWSDGTLSRFSTLPSLARSHLLISDWTDRDDEVRSTQRGVWAWSADSKTAVALAEDQLWTHPSWVSDQRPVYDGVSIWSLTNGALSRGLPGDPWASISLPFRTDYIWSAIGETPLNSRLWLLSEGRIWRLNPHLERPQLALLSLEGSWRGGVVDESGRLLLWGDSGMVRVDWERSAQWEADSTIIAESPVDFKLIFDAPESAVSVDAWIDDREQTLEISRETDWSLSLSNLDLDSGDHILFAEVTYDDGQRASAALNLFANPQVTWSDDIIHIYEANCAMCHNGQGGARNLSNPALWADDVDTILFVTRMQSMPIGLPPLTLEEINLIESWRLGGFKE